MGLYAEIDLRELGPDMLEDDDTGASVPVDYSDAIEVFIDTFLTVSMSLCPVDTGYLMSTIDAGDGGSYVYAEATADYAEYVEYGTVYMDAQPYFEPALELAVNDLLEAMQQALDAAEEMLQEIVASIISSMMDSVSAAFNNSWGGIFLGAAAAAVTLFVLFPIILIGYGIAEVFTIENTYGGSTEPNVGGAGYDNFIGLPGIEVIIT